MFTRHCTRVLHASLVVCVFFICCFVELFAQVSSVAPAKNALNVQPNTTIQVTFNEAMLTTSFYDTSSFLVYGKTSGRHRGSFSFSNGNTVATFTPTTVFKKGEMVSVALTNKLKTAADIAITPVVFEFTIITDANTGTFATKVDYATGTSPWSVYVSDVDGDGDGDMLAGIYQAVSVLKNNGDGTFATKVNYSTGEGTSVYVSDIDGDGDMDIMSANQTPNTVSVLKNNGNGTFATKVDYATGTGPQSVYANDIDGDGDGDIMTANNGSSSVSLLKNNGNGTFATKVDYATGSSPRSVYVSDIDGDGDGDIMTSNTSSNSISVLKNNGNGTFATKVDYATGNFPYSVYASDIDGDGDADIMVANIYSHTFSVLKNNGNGTFATKVDYGTGSYPTSVYASDIDGDSDSDILVSNLSSNSVSVLKNNGDGTFSTKVDYATGTEPRSVYASDIDGDGDVDIMAANTGSATVSVLKNVYMYTIAATSVGLGTINPSGAVGVISGANQTFTFTPNSNYYVDSVIVDGVKVDSTTSYTFTNVTANHTIRAVFAENVKVIAVSPTKNAINVAPSANIQVTFNSPVSTSSLNDTSSFIVSGSVSGRHRGSFSFSGGNTVATFDPTNDFKNGEKIFVALTSNIKGSNNIALPPVVFEFTIVTAGSSGRFETKVDYATGLSPQSVYANDIDGDGDADMLVTNNSSNTVSVLKNNGNGTFATKVDYITGSGPQIIYVSDIDVDGDGDMLVNNYNSYTVSVMKNNGDGTFATKVDYATGVWPSSVYASDIDGDGDGDILVANNGSNTVSVLKNNGDGTFATKVDRATGSNPSSVYAADIDGDGDNDIMIANNVSNGVTIWKNNGTGAFPIRLDYYTGVSPRSVYASDIDGDGDNDMMFANEGSDNVSVLKNNGDGTFATNVDYSAGDGPVSVYASDMDGDGDGDILVANWNSDNVSVLKNNGNGTFATKVDYSSGDAPFSAYASDIDGDGASDIIVANLFSYTISVLKNITTSYTITATSGGTGNGTINPAGEVSVFYGADKTFSITPNADSHIDSVIVDGVRVASTSYLFTFVTSNHTIRAVFAINGKVTAISPTQHALNVAPSSNIQVTLNVPMSTSSFNDTTSFIVSGSVSGRHTGNFSFSGGNTVATFDPTTDFKNGEMVTVDVTRNIKDGTNYGMQSFVSQFTVSSVVSSGTFSTKVDYSAEDGPSSVCVSDLDGDGDGDIITANRNSDNISVLKNNGNGTFATKVNYTIYGHPYSVHVSDIDGDGDGDVITVTYGSWLGDLVYVLRNNGDGTLGYNDFFIATGMTPHSVYASDIDWDGYADIVTANFGSNTVSVFQNNGNGTYGSRVDYATGSLPNSVYVSDLDGDGDGDMMVANVQSSTVSVLKNNGDRTFATKVDYATGNGPYSVYARDIDGDGDGDIITANAGPNTVSVLKNNGDGTFATKVDYTTGSIPLSVYASDIDGDGDGDILTANYDANTVSLLKNNGDGTFATKMDYTTGGFPTSVIASDMDGDGDGDILTANENSDNVSVLKNINTYTITATSNGNGTIIPSGTVNVIEGANQNFTIISNMHYHIDSVIVDGVKVDSTTSYTFTNVTAHHTIQAVFALDTYTITVPQGTNGTISPGTSIVNYGTDKQFFITPNTGFHIDSVFVDGVFVDSTTSYMFDNVTENHTITATFAINRYTLMVNAENGIVTKNPDQGTYDYGTEVILTATGNTGYHFEDWSRDLSGTENPDTLTMDGDKTVTATFAINTYSLIVNVENGSVATNPDQASYSHGTSVELTATPATGYHFVDWSGDLAGTENPDTITMDANKIVTANFTINTYTLTVNAENGSVTRNPEQASYNHGTSVELTAIPTAGYHFVNWFDGEVNNNDNPVTVTMNANQTITAHFAINIYTLNVTERENGSITPGTTTVEHGSAQSFTISANTGYHIDSVVVDGVKVDSTENYTFNNVTENHTLDVSFAINIYTLTSTAGENGSINPSGDMSVNYGGSQAYTITANADYHILDVLVDSISVGAVSSYTFENVASNHTISVTFEYTDVLKFRTFKESVTGFTAKTVKLAYKKGKLVAPPNMLTALENVFAKQVPKAGLTFLGVSQGTNKDSAKAYAWIDIKKAAELTKGFKTAHSGQSYPLDYLRDAVKGTKKKLSKAIKFESKYNNPAIAQGILFKLNILASDSGITPKGFSSLVLDTTIALAGREMHGQTLTQIANYYDSIMTYWKRFGVDTIEDYQQLSNFVLFVLKPINDGFFAEIDTAMSTQNYSVDSTAVVVAKKPYSVTLNGAKTATEVGVVKYVPTTKSEGLLFSASQEELPSGINLQQNYPNPFNPTTAIGFSLLAVGNVSLKIYNILGQEVATLLNNEQLEAGAHEIQFDASALTSGVYFYRLSVDGKFSETKKLILMK